MERFKPVDDEKLNKMMLDIAEHIIREYKGSQRSFASGYVIGFLMGLFKDVIFEKEGVAA